MPILTILMLHEAVVFVMFWLHLNELYLRLNLKSVNLYVITVFEIKVASYR